MLSGGDPRVGQLGRPCSKDRMWDCSRIVRWIELIRRRVAIAVAEWILDGSAQYPLAVRWRASVA